MARVHAHRLRKKLSEYYMGPGAGDPWIIRIPTGSYVPGTTPAAPAQAGPPVEPPRPPPILPSRHPEDLDSAAATTPAAADIRSRPGRSVVWIAAATTAVALAAAWGHFGAGGESAPSRVEQLWADFLAPEAAPTAMVFQETVFLTNDKILLRYNGPYSGPTGSGVAATEDVRPYVDAELLARAGPLIFNRTYASIGQVYCVQALTLLFARAGKAPPLRPFRLLRGGEASGENLILSDVSSLTIANQSLEHFRKRSGSYGYKSVDQPAIENLEPGPGELEEYAIEFDLRTQERKADYALVAFLPGRQPHLRVALMDGLTAAGTWAATKALTTEEGLEDLSRLLGEDQPRFFEAVVRAELHHDQVMSFSFVAARRRGR